MKPFSVLAQLKEDVAQETVAEIEGQEAADEAAAETYARTMDGVQEEGDRC